jgi:RNA polymerase sigma factor (sigma-70 family)
MSENDMTLKGVLKDAPHLFGRPGPVKRVEDIDHIRLRTFAFRYTRDVPTTFDIVQNVYLKILELSQPERDAIRCLQAWAFRVVRNEALNWLRTRNRHVPADCLENHPASDPDPALYVIDTEEARHLLERLHENYRVPFLLCRVYGYSAEEVAEELGLKVDTVWKRVQRAFDLLQQEISGVPSPKSRIRSFFQRKEQK